MDSDGLFALIEAVYETAVDGAEWTEVLTTLAQALHSPKIVLESVEPDSLATAVHFDLGWDPSLAGLYERDYARKDPLIRDAVQRPLGSVFTDDLLADYKAYQSSAVYNEVYAPSRAEHVVASFMLRDAGRSLVLAFRRGVDIGPYTATERQLFAAIFPHVVRSLDLRRQFSGVRRVREALGEAMERMAYAVVLVAADSRVIEMNECARCLLTAGDGLGVRAGYLTATAPSANSALDGLIAATAGANGEAPPPASSAIPIPRPSCLRPYTVLVAPLPTRHEWSLANDALALVFIRDPEDAPQPASDAIAALYGLTPAEARLAAALAAGQTVKEYAESAGITENTARWTLKQVLSKTDTRGQSDLLRLILTGPAALATGGREGS